jgi:DNA-binding MarR family transcriptional regulator
MTNPTPPTPSSDSRQLAEEVFGLTVMFWRERLASRGNTNELSESQFLTLDLLERQGTLNVGEIQRSIGVLPAQMSRIIRSLESGFDKPLIRCELNQQDKRKIDVSTTPFGHRTYEEFRNSRLVKTQDILARLPANDCQEFIRICRNIKQLYNSEGGVSASAETSVKTP